MGYDLFMNFLKDQRGSCSCQWRDRHHSDFIEKIFISVLKMNENEQVWNDMRVSN